MYRGSVLWNIVTNSYNTWANDIQNHKLRVRLKSLDILDELIFKITSAPTCSIRKDEFVYMFTGRIRFQVNFDLT